MNQITLLTGALLASLFAAPPQDDGGVSRWFEETIPETTISVMGSVTVSQTVIRPGTKKEVRVVAYAFKATRAGFRTKSIVMHGHTLVDANDTKAIVRMAGQGDFRVEISIMGAREMKWSAINQIHDLAVHFSEK